MRLLDAFKVCKFLQFEGIFSHDGNSYRAENIDELKEVALYLKNSDENFKNRLNSVMK